MNLFAKYHNTPLIACAIIACLQYKPTIDIAKLSIIIPSLLDERICNYLHKSQDGRTLANFMMLNQRNISNYNARYYALLPHFATALSMLMEMDVIVLKKGKVTTLNTNIFEDMSTSCDSKKIQSITEVTNRFLRMVDNISTRKLFTMFNVQL